MSEHHIAIVDGSYRVYTTTDGRDRHYVGPKFDRPAGAAAYAALLDDVPHVSPVRPSVEPSAIPVAEGSAERRTRSGRPRG